MYLAVGFAHKFNQTMHDRRQLQLELQRERHLTKLKSLMHE